MIRNNSLIRSVLNRIVPWRRPLILLCLAGALMSLVLVSSASVEEGALGGAIAATDKHREPKALVSGYQDQAAVVGAVQVDIPSVKPKIFHGDVRRLPLVKPTIKQPRREPKEPGPELPATSAPDTTLQPFAAATPAPASTNFPGLDFQNW